MRTEDWLRMVTILLALVASWQVITFDVRNGRRTAAGAMLGGLLAATIGLARVIYHHHPTANFGDVFVLHLGWWGLIIGSVRFVVSSRKCPYHPECPYTEGRIDRQCPSES